MIYAVLLSAIKCTANAISTYVINTNDIPAVYFVNVQSEGSISIKSVVLLNKFSINTVLKSPIRPPVPGVLVLYKMKIIRKHYNSVHRSAVN